MDKSHRFTMLENQVLEPWIFEDLERVGVDNGARLLRLGPWLWDRCQSS